MFLGVILDEILSWKLHISHVARKISKSIDMIYKAIFRLSGRAMRILYSTLVYPYLATLLCNGLGFNLSIQFKSSCFASKMGDTNHQIRHLLMRTLTQYLKGL